MDLISRSGGFLTLLKKKNFLRLWLAQLISLTVFNASNSALLVLINTISGGSTTQIGLAIICFSLPAVLFGAPAGVIVDHMDKRLVLWGSNCLRALASLLFVGILLFSRNTLLPFIYLLTFLISTISQFFIPAEGSMIPLLVEGEELMPALSLFNITLMLSQALGYILLAPLALLLLPTFTIAHITIDASIQLYSFITLFYLVCAFLILSIPPANFATGAPLKQNHGDALTTKMLHAVSDVWHDMRQGWDFVRRNRALMLAIVQLSFAGVLILVIGEIATPIVTQLLLLPGKMMAFIFAPAGVGLVVGSILMPRITKRQGNVRVIFGGALLLALVTTLLPLVIQLTKLIQPHGWNTNPLLLLAVALIMCVAGVALDAVNIPALTNIQELTPGWIKGRVLALQLVLYNAASIPVILFLGALSDSLGITSVLYTLSICSLVFGCWGVYYGRKHVRKDSPAQSETRDQQLESDTALPPSQKSH